jgi:hypothetical protein
MSRMAPRDHPLVARKRDPHERLLRALLALAGPDTRVESASAVSWSSATFEGSRHEATLIFEGEYARQHASAFAEQAPEAEFEIAGHIVADLTIDSRHMSYDATTGLAYVRVALSALIVEDW